MRTACKNKTQFSYFMQNIVEEGGGEGLILRKARSVYEHGKSVSLLKLKVILYQFMYPFFIIRFSLSK